MLYSKYNYSYLNKKILVKKFSRIMPHSYPVIGVPVGDPDLISP